MKTLPLSSKYQVVIPKIARQKLGITGPGDSLYIKSVSSTEIVLSKTVPVKDQFLAMLESTPRTETDAVDRVRNLRKEWDK